MKITGLDGKIYSWNPVSGGDRKCSSLHTNARELLKELYTGTRILEEVSLPGTKPMLFADFYLPIRKMIIEVHGEQHYKWVMHYHATKKDWIEARRRDNNKKQWCQINHMYYVELPYSENIDEWRYRIVGASKDRSEE